MKLLHIIAYCLNIFWTLVANFLFLVSLFVYFLPLSDFIKVRALLLTFKFNPANPPFRHNHLSLW